MDKRKLFTNELFILNSAHIETILTIGPRASHNGLGTG
jgi:hypothetical protein